MEVRLILPPLCYPSLGIPTIVRDLRRYSMSPCMTVLDIGFGNAVWVRARVRIYESSRRVGDREYKVINAYIPLPTTVRYFGFRNGGAPVRIWLFKDNRYMVYEGNIRRIHKSQYGGRAYQRR